MLTSTLDSAQSNTATTLSAWDLSTQYTQQALPAMIDAVPNSAELLTALEDQTRQLLAHWSIELLGENDLDSLAESIAIAAADLCEASRARGLRAANPRELAMGLESIFASITGPENRIAAIRPTR